MRLRAVLAAALTLGALAVPRAGAAPNEIVLTGSRSGWVVIESSYQVFGEPVVETKGRYGGYYAEVLSAIGGGDPEFQSGGWLAIRGLATDSQRLVPQPLWRTPQTRPGVIRFYLIADGPTTVRIRTNGPTRGEIYVPTHPAATQFRLAPMTQRAGRWYGDLPLRVPKGGASLAVAQAGGDVGIVAADAYVCLRPRDGVCPDHLLRRTPATGEGDASYMERRWADSPQPGYGRDGNLLATARIEAPRPIRRAVLAGFSLALVGR